MAYKNVRSSSLVKIGLNPIANCARRIERLRKLSEKRRRKNANRQKLRRQE
jgi:hypothetical protein